MASCLLRLRLNPSEYRAWGLNRSGVAVEEALNYVPNRVYWDRVQPHLNDSTFGQRLSNKLWFAEFCARDGLPTPELVAVIDRNGCVIVDNEPTPHTIGRLGAFLTANGVGEVVLKPARGWQGQGVVRIEVGGLQGIFTVVPQSRQRLELTSDQDWAAAAPHLFGPGLGTVLVQRRVRQHAFLDHFSRGAACTLRIATLRNRSGDAVCLSAELRLAREGSPTDNFSQGGLGVIVDRNTGVLSQGVMMRNGRVVEITEHPDSGRPFVGEVFPDWQACRDLALTAARRIPGLNLVGWDVLLTPEGPILLEGNHDADPYFQQAGGLGLLNEEFRPVLAGWGLEFPSAMPPVTPRGVIRGIKTLLRG